MENLKPFALNGKIWAIYCIEKGTLFLHMLNPHEIPKSILDALEEDFIFLIGVAESEEGNDFDMAAFLNLTPDQVDRFCEENTRNQT